MVGVATSMQDLQRDLPALGMHCTRDSLVLHRSLASCESRGKWTQPAFDVGRIASGDHQADPTACPCSKVFGKSWQMLGAILEPGMHRAHHYPVAKRGEAEIERGEQIWIDARLIARFAHR